MPPLVLRKDTPPETVKPCTDCPDAARAVWVGDDHKAVPLCDACVAQREKEYLNGNNR